MCDDEIKFTIFALYMAQEKLFSAGFEVSVKCQTPSYKSYRRVKIQSSFENLYFKSENSWPKHC